MLKPTTSTARQMDFSDDRGGDNREYLRQPSRHDGRMGTTTKGTELPMTFVNLDSLVGETICTFLEQGDLLTLRSVCKTTKGWVENAPKNLARICIDIRHSSHLDRILKPKRTVDFTNFKIRVEKLGSQTHLSNQFATDYGPRIKVLKVTSTSGYFRKIDLLLCCPSLEVVQISDLSYKNVPEESINILRINFQNYTSFELDDLNTATADHLFTLIKWITCSTKLENVRLPLIQFENGHPILPKVDKQAPLGVDYTPPTPEDIINEFCYSHILLPLIRSIKNGSSRLKTVDVERFCLNLNHCDARFLKELAQVCYKHQVKITNVPMGQLHPEEMHGEITQLLGTIQSCRGFQLGKVDVKNLSSLKNLTCSVGFATPMPIDEINYEKELDFPCLESLNLNIFSMMEEIPRNTVVALLSTPRESLRKLVVAWNMNSTAFFTVNGEKIGIGKSFPNLKVLELSQWKGCVTEFENLFRGLVLLEEITIRDCKGLADGAFVGTTMMVNFSSFRKLTKLRKVNIRCYDRGVTDVSLKTAFCMLPLRSLTISFVGLSSISIHGFAALDRLPFKNSIQYLNIQLQDGIPYAQIRKVIEQFGNLKKHKID